jgi:hypothetical protein
LQQAARYALNLAEEGKLLGASQRQPVGGGDMYVIQADDGPRLLIRAATAGGGASGLASASDGTCAAPSGGNARYVELPPGAVDVLMQFMRAEGWAWPEPTADGFVLRAPGSTQRTLPTITCSDDAHCVLKTGDVVLKSGRGPLTLSVDAVLRYAPRPVG